MSTSTAATPTRYATRDFKDEGTGKSFKAGKPIEAEPGVIANYEAAGLAGDKGAEPETEAPAKGKPAA